MFALAHAHAAGMCGYDSNPSVSQKREDRLLACLLFFGGDGGIRTLDLTDANRTLSQLSYAPKTCRNDSFCIIAYFLIL